MEAFQELISNIPDARALLVPNNTLATSTLNSLENLVDDCNEYIITQGFTEEQIWAQISLITPKILQKIKEAPQVPEQNEPESDISEIEESDLSDNQDSRLPDDHHSDSSDHGDSSHQSSSLSDTENNNNLPNIESDESDLNEQKDFFDPDEMNRFADEGEMEFGDPGMKLSEESEDEEELQADPKYEGFFNDEEPSEEEPEKLFSYIDDKEMERLEEKMISDKPWQLKGEISSKNRPKDSLLNEVLDFDLARKAQPQTQTKEVTDEIEEIIKQRIQDMLFDDVQPKRSLEKPQTKTAAEDFLDYEKSKKSLAELYEDDFKKQVLHLPVNTETERAKKEITVVFKKLCYNLDLISALNPVPKPVVQDLEIKNSKTPALVLEEVLPYATSTQALLKPEQVFDTKNTVLKAPEELTKSDKNTARKRHKSTMRTRKKERIIKLMNKIAQDPKAQKFEYRKMLKEDKARKELITRKKQPNTKFTRSSEFFKNFQKLNNELSEKKKVKEVPLSKKIKL